MPVVVYRSFWEMMSKVTPFSLSCLMRDVLANAAPGGKTPPLQQTESIQLHTESLQKSENILFCYKNVHYPK